jgi:hypothetical protein
MKEVFSQDGLGFWTCYDRDTGYRGIGATKHEAEMDLMDKIIEAYNNLTINSPPKETKS